MKRTDSAMRQLRFIFKVFSATIALAGVSLSLGARAMALTPGDGAPAPVSDGGTTATKTGLQFQRTGRSHRTVASYRPDTLRTSQRSTM